MKTISKKQAMILRVLTWGTIFIFWFMSTKSNQTLLPSPQNVLNAFSKLIREGYNAIPLLDHLGISLTRLFTAVVIAILTAIPLGLCSGYSSWFRAIVDSLVNFYRPLPPMSYYVLVIMWLGIDEESKIVLLFLAAFSPIYIACVSAVAHINQEYIRSAQSLGANKLQIFITVVVPASLPEIFTGIRTAVGVGYTTLVSAEMIAATSGIGWMVMDAYNYLKTDVVFVAIIIMGLTGILLDLGFKIIAQKTTFWVGK